jgi:hypothetical protein
MDLWNWWHNYLTDSCVYVCIYILWFSGLIYQIHLLHFFIKYQDGINFVFLFIRHKWHCFSLGWLPFVLQHHVILIWCLTPVQVSWMKMEPGCSSNTLTSIYNTVWDHKLNSHHHENLKSNIHICFFHLSCDVKEKCQVNMTVVIMLRTDSVRCMSELGMRELNRRREEHRRNLISLYRWFVLHSQGNGPIRHVETCHNPPPPLQEYTQQNPLSKF